MKISRKTQSSGGFAVIETVLILVIVAAVIGVGGYVVKQNRNASKDVSSTASVATPQAAKASSTSAVIDQSALLDSTTETGLDNTADGQTINSAMSDDSSINNVGGAYNESSL